MKDLVCKHCGSNCFTKIDGCMVCDYCGTKYEVQQTASSSIQLNDDVRDLLEKCWKNPAKASKYARLILEIDPFNIEAKQYL